MPGANTLTMRNGCRFLRTAALILIFYTIRPRETDELFPWDFIDAGVTKEFLIREVGETARSEVVTPNCRERCSGCGARKYKRGVCYEN